MSDGYHIYPYGRRVVVSGRRVGFVLAADRVGQANLAKPRLGGPTRSDGVGVTDDLSIGHARLESTVRYLGIEMDDTLEKWRNRQKFNQS